MTGPEFDPEPDGGCIEVEIGLIGTVGPYFAYDIEDPRAPVKEKRGPGFVRLDEYVKGGVVKTYKRKRKR